MNEKTVDEVYAANAAIREKLRSVVEPLDENKLNNKPEGEKWSVGDIVEHLSMVEGSIVRVCGKLLAKAENENRMGDGLIRTSDNFAEKGVEVATVKVEAPEFVRPTGGRPIADSFEALKKNGESLTELKPLFEKFDSAESKFPHPFFGDMSAGEWLMLIGGHEARHIRQIRAIIEKF